MAGRDATRSLAAGKVFEQPPGHMQSFDDYLDLSDVERGRVNEWVDFFYSKYPEVGVLVRIKDPRHTFPEDVFSKMGSPPHGGIMDGLHLPGAAQA